MKSFILRYIWLVLFLSLLGCNSKGAPAPAPTNVQVVAGDTSATVTWDMAPGVQYFLWWAPTPSLSPDSCATTPTCLAATNVSSPYVITGLTNLTSYAVTVNGRTGGGPGGPGSPSVQVTPRLAGASWTATNISSSTLNGVIYGTGNQFVAAGNNGALFGSADGINWGALANPLPSTNFTAVANSGGTYLVAGAAGVILYSPDYAVTWTQQTSNTVNNLNAIYGYGSGIFVAAGDAGTILTSDSSGTVWTNRSTTTGTSNALYGVSYGNGTYVAVGAAGTLITSTDSVNWTANTTISGAYPAETFKSVSYGVVSYSATASSTAYYPVGTPVFVVVGSSGTVLYSSDNGATWTQTTAGANTLNAVTFGDHFVAVDNLGNVYSSLDGQSWAQSYASTTAGLNAIAPGPSPTYTYSAVGMSGLVMHSM